MSDMVLAGGTVVTAEASFRADVAVEDEQIAAVGRTTCPTTAPRSSTSPAPC